MTDVMDDNSKLESPAPAPALDTQVFRVLTVSGNVVAELLVPVDEDGDFDYKAKTQLLLAWANSTGNNLSNLDLTNFNFDELNLRDVNFMGSNLDNARFLRATLYDCNFTGCNLEDVSFSGAQLSHCSFEAVQTMIDASMGGTLVDQCPGLVHLGVLNGWTVWAYWSVNGPRIRAGCRTFDLNEAREHWDVKNCNGDRDEIRAAITLVDAIAKTRLWEAV